MTTTPETVAKLWAYSGRVRVLVAAFFGVVAAFVDRALGPKDTMLLAGWDAAATVYFLWVVFTVFRLDAGNTAGLASDKGPGRATIDLVMLVASLASLGGVGLVLLQVGDAKASDKVLLPAIGVVSVLCSWVLVHTVYTLRYARIFYDECEGGGIDFNFNEEDENPCYLDFAYFAFTVGMTFQVSDTSISDRRIRRTVLHHSLLSYLFGTVIVATTINLVAGLGK